MQVTPQITLARRYDLAGHPIQLQTLVTEEGADRAWNITQFMDTDGKGQVNHKTFALHLIATGEALMRFNAES